MRYVYERMPKSSSITLIASELQETEALRADMQKIGARLILCGKDSRSMIGHIRSYVRTDRPDCIHSHGFTSATLAYIATFLHAIPHVVTIHGIVEKRLLAGWSAPLKRSLLGWVCCHVNVLHGVGNDIMEHVQQQFPGLKRSKTRCVVIRNGIDTHWFASGKSADSTTVAPEIVESNFLFLYVGRFMPQKGFDLLLRALAELKKEPDMASFHLLACGSGDFLREYQAQAAEMGVMDTITFIPFQSDPRALYYRADAVVIPSRWEAYPLAPCEALSCGKPVVAARCIGLREAVEDTPALVFEPEDVSGLVEQMRRSMQPEQIERFSSFQKEAITRFDVTKTADQLHGLLRSQLRPKQTAEPQKNSA